MTDLVKKEEKSFALTSGKLVSRASSFKQRVEQAKKEEVDPNTMPNRLCLMLDVSGSMSTTESNDKSRIDLLKEAIQSFVSRCNFANTSIALKTFPSSGRRERGTIEPETAKLTTNGNYIIAMSLSLTAGGGTPLRQCVEDTLNEVPLTRGIVVSDGGATDWRGSFDGDDSIEDRTLSYTDGLLTKYKDLGIPLDCVHISLGEDGEELLRRIAKETGGLFIKFADVSAFSRGFGYLTPGYRAMLTSGDVSASDIGARELK